jgi:hypothetical protein
MRLFFSPNPGKCGMLVVLVALIGICGCGPATGTVSGTVTYKGTKLKGGNVTFVSTEGKPSKSTTIQPDGTYMIVGVPAGAVKICVETQSLNPGVGSNTPKNEPPPGQKSPYGKRKQDNADLYVEIPDTYAQPETTKLTYTVTSGKQEKSITLD